MLPQRSVCALFVRLVYCYASEDTMMLGVFSCRETWKRKRTCQHCYADAYTKYGTLRTISIMMLSVGFIGVIINTLLALHFD